MITTIEIQDSTMQINFSRSNKGKTTTVYVSVPITDQTKKSIEAALDFLNKQMVV